MTFLSLRKKKDFEIKKKQDRHTHTHTHTHKRQIWFYLEKNHKVMSWKWREFRSTDPAIDMLSRSGVLKVFRNQRKKKEAIKERGRKKKGTKNKPSKKKGSKMNENIVLESRFFYRVLLGLTVLYSLMRFRGILLGFTVFFLCVLSEFCWGWLRRSRFDRVISSNYRFYWVLLGFQWISRSLIDFMHLYLFMRGFLELVLISTIFYLVLLKFIAS